MVRPIICPAASGVLAEEQIYTLDEVGVSHMSCVDRLLTRVAVLSIKRGGKGSIWYKGTVLLASLKQHWAALHPMTSLSCYGCQASSQCSTANPQPVHVFGQVNKLLSSCPCLSLLRDMRAA